MKPASMLQASIAEGNNGYDTNDEWAPELLICASGLAVALASKIPLTYLACCIIPNRVPDM